MKDKKPERGNRTLSKEEQDYIRDNCWTKTDVQLSQELNRSMLAVSRWRKKLGITKVQGGSIENYDANKKAGKPQEIVLTASNKLTEPQRKAFFQAQLTNTMYYRKLKEQFTDDEMNFYLEEWGALCLQFEDIVATEKRQIDELIKVTIMGIRILRNVKITEEEIGHLQEEIEEFRGNHKDLENDPAAQTYDETRTMLLRNMMGQSTAMSNDYQKNIGMKNQLLGELNARRRDRVDSLIKRGTTFLGLVSAFRDKQAREEHGKHMELVKMAREKNKTEWRLPNKFEDGTQDCILMDEHSVLPQKDTVYLADMGSRLVEKYNKDKEQKRVLILDDDPKRQQFFAEVFNHHKLTFSSSVQKAMQEMAFRKSMEKPYDLVCIDYDLGMSVKGLIFVENMIKDEWLKDSDFLVQSENKDGAKQLLETLKENDYRVEACPFYEILKVYMDQKNKENQLFEQSKEGKDATAS